jgi:hypothetical protein
LYIPVVVTPILNHVPEAKIEFSAIDLGDAELPDFGLTEIFKSNDMSFSIPFDDFRKGRMRYSINGIFFS